MAYCHSERKRQRAALPDTAHKQWQISHANINFNISGVMKRLDRASDALWQDPHSRRKTQTVIGTQQAYLPCINPLRLQLLCINPLRLTHSEPREPLITATQRSLLKVVVLRCSEWYTHRLAIVFFLLFSTGTSYIILLETFFVSFDLFRKHLKTYLSVKTLTRVGSVSDLQYNTIQFRLLKTIRIKTGRSQLTQPQLRRQRYQQSLCPHSLGQNFFPAHIVTTLQRNNFPEILLVGGCIPNIPNGGTAPELFHVFVTLFRECIQRLLQRPTRSRMYAPCLIIGNKTNNNRSQLRLCQLRPPCLYSYRLQ